MIARVKWCKPVSSCTRLRPNVKCFNTRKGGKLATLSEIHSCCRNVVECAIDLAVTRRMYPLEGDEQERAPIRIRFGSETSRNTIVENTFRQNLLWSTPVSSKFAHKGRSHVIDLTSENN